MTAFDAAYIAGGLLLVTFELYAMYLGNKHGERQHTISAKVHKWVLRSPKWRRILIFCGLVWLLWHWVFQKF